jgi:rhodanese-related sulfurtransferase/TusA-related sulfurtransferase
VNSHNVDKVVDCKGLSCPMPVVKTKRAIAEVAPGQVLGVFATDPGSVADVKSWAARTGHQFLGTTEEDGVFKHFIRRSDPKDVMPERTHPNTISNEQLLERLVEEPVIVDVREPMEFSFGHIPGALSVPLGHLEHKLEALKTHLKKELYVICHTGNRSDAACQILHKHGFENVVNVSDGMNVWQGPIEKHVSDAVRA